MRVAVLAVVLGASIGGQPRSLPAPVTIPATFDRDISGDRLIVPVTVNDRVFPCHLDSGGGATLSVDKDAAERAGLRATGRGSSAGAGATAMPDLRVEGASIRIGNVPVPGATVILRPFEPEAPEFDCLFGLTLLRDYVVELDYVTPHVRIHDPAHFEPPSGAVAIPFTLERNHPIADMTLALADGERVVAKVVLDTGAAYYSAALLKPFISQHNLINRIGKIVPRPEVETTPIRLLAARPPALSLGPVRVQEPVIALFQTDTPFLAVDGLLGEGFFIRFDVTFDYRRRTMWLRPNARVAERQSFDASGVRFINTPDARHHVAAAVVAGSAAALAGVQKGDVLVTLDDRNADELTTKQIALALSRAGQVCVLGVRRNGQYVPLTLRLAARL